MDVQALVILVGLCSLVIGLAVYVIRRLSLFSKTPKEGFPLSNAEFQLTGASFVFYGLMVICMIGLPVWAVQAMELQGKAARNVYGGVPLLVGLVFAALYFALESLGVRFKKKRG